MGNNMVCFENICNENIYEINWINNKNWKIDYQYHKIENPYILERGNFKIINDGKCQFYLLKKIDYEYEIEKLLINISFQYTLNQYHKVKIDLVILDDDKNINNYDENILDTITIYKNKINTQINEIKIKNDFQYELFINFNFLDYILFENKIMKRDKILGKNKSKIKFNNEKNNLFFGFIIHSDLENNPNMENYLNIKVL